MKKNNKGFTLMEMLIVVAIIAILVAIAIPTLSNQLEKAREATDEANIRSIYAQLASDVLLENTTGTCPTAKSYSVTKQEDGSYTGVATYTMTQQNAGTANGASVTIGGSVIASGDFKKGDCTITVKGNGTTTISWAS